MPLARGYHRDADSVFYLTESGAMYLVYEAEAPEPLWRRCDGECLSPDDEPARLGAEEMDEYETVRKAYEIVV
jgi:hypothetical protein